MMLPEDIHREIEKLNRQVGVAERDAARYADALANALAVEPQRYSEGEVTQTRAGKARAEERASVIRERIAALEQQLPSPEAVHDAQNRVTEHEERAEQVQTRFDESRERLMAALEPVAEAMREMGALHSEGVDLKNRIDSEVRQFGLATAVPQVPTLPLYDATIARLVGEALTSLACGGPVEPMVTTQLSDAREKQLAAS